MNQYKSWLDNSKSIHSLIKENALSNPNSIALIEGDIKLSYGELDRITDSMAYDLAHKYGVKEDSIIGVYIEKSINYILACLSILKTGAQYLHLDEDYNQDILTHVLGECKAALVLSSEKLISNLNTKEKVLITYLNRSNKTGFCVNTNNEKTAIVGFTSGTTGPPKGVEVSHRACIYSFNKFWEEVDHIQPRENFGYITYLAWDAFSPLIHGATGIMIPTAANTDMELLKRSLVEYKVNHAFFTPSLLDKFLNSFDLLIAKEALRNLNIIWVGGEIIKPQTIEKLFEVHPHANLFNNYGPTECFVVSQGELVKEYSNRTKEIPAGRILPELDYILLDENNKDVTESGLGYLYITGAALANGYHKREDLNKKKFVKIEDKIYYETGDYSQVSQDRTIAILARNSFILETETENLPVSFIEQKILEKKLINKCIIINSKKELMVFCITNESSVKKDIEEILKNYTDDFKVIFIDEVPLKASSQKINYSLLLEQYS